MVKKKTRPGWKLLADRSVKVYLFLLMALTAACILAPVVAVHDPDAINLADKFAAVSPAHPMGTDYLGRDLFARVLWGGRNTLGYAALITAVSAVLGTGVGMFCAFIGGRVDRMIMRGSDVLRSFPGIVLVMIVVSVRGVGIENVCLAMMITRWIWYARMARNLTRVELGRSSVMASRLAGSSWFKILRRNVLMSILPEMLPTLSLDFGGALLAISGYSFLGLGVLPPEAEWGMMISDGRSYMDHPGMMFWPGLCVVAVVISVNYLGDKIRDILEEERL
ncbi:MAG: ABC transporter permease subunit [Clostridiales bacterium]|nr:ABC transporter permease subunit [Clostridiales bacterium]